MIPGRGTKIPHAVWHSQKKKKERGQTAEARRTTILQPVEEKPHSQKDRQRTLYQMKEQYKTPEKQLNEVEIGNLPEKEFRIIIVKTIQDLGKRMEAGLPWWHNG